VKFNRNPSSRCFRSCGGHGLPTRYYVGKVPIKANPCLPLSNVQSRQCSLTRYTGHFQHVQAIPNQYEDDLHLTPSPNGSVNKRLAKGCLPKVDYWKGNKLISLLPRPGSFKGLPTLTRNGYRGYFPQFLIIQMMQFIKNILKDKFFTTQNWYDQSCIPPTSNNKFIFILL
jgi:hypothetical protein